VVEAWSSKLSPQSGGLASEDRVRDKQTEMRLNWFKWMECSESLPVSAGHCETLGFNEEC
jgi:hypothetical protein